MVTLIRVLDGGGTLPMYRQHRYPQSYPAFDSAIVAMDDLADGSNTILVVALTLGYPPFCAVRHNAIKSAYVITFSSFHDTRAWNLA